MAPRELPWKSFADEAPPARGHFVTWSPDFPSLYVMWRAPAFYDALQEGELAIYAFSHWLEIDRPNGRSSQVAEIGA